MCVIETCVYVLFLCGAANLLPIKPQLLDFIKCLLEKSNSTTVLELSGHLSSTGLHDRRSMSVCSGVDLKPPSGGCSSICVKDYCVPLVLGLQSWEGSVFYTSESRLLPFPGLPLGWGWGAATAEARGNGDISSLILHCDPFLHLGWKTQRKMLDVVVSGWYLTGGKMSKALLFDSKHTNVSTFILDSVTQPLWSPIIPIKSIICAG